MAQTPRRRPCPPTPYWPASIKTISSMPCVRTSVAQPVHLLAPTLARTRSWARWWPSLRQPTSRISRPGWPACHRLWQCASKLPVSTKKPALLQAFLCLPNLARGGVPADQVQVFLGIQRGAQALGFPYGFAQCLHDDVGRFMMIASGKQTLVGSLDSRGLIDGKLLIDRQMHGQMQKRIGPALLHREISIGDFRVFQVGMVFGMLAHEIHRHGFQRSQHAASLVLVPRLGKKLPHLIARGVEQHDKSRYKH